MNNILVTGGAGFIGSNFIYYMLKKHPDYRIVCIDALTYAGNLSTLEEAEKSENFRFVKADITDRKAVEALFEEENFTAVVNSVDFAKELRAFENIDVYIAGGKMRKSGSLVDTFAVEFVSKLHFDICFITGSGLTAEFGLSNGSDETATFQRTVLKNSRRKYLLLASSKIGVNSFVKVCNANEFDTIITDWDCAEEQIAALEDTGVKVIVAEESK